ncbi:MAG: hypothetical protein QNJ00_01110 [Woeseiaceae bacterium]|nr:hypothetical protein [Woeseiaceae bacterium]
MPVLRLTALLAAAAMLAGCGTRTVNAFVGYDTRNFAMGCGQAREIVNKADELGRDYQSTVQIAQSKLNWCNVSGKGPFFVAGYFNSAAKVYEFREVRLDDASAVNRFCLDVAAANNVLDTPPAKLRFVMRTISGETETVRCDAFVRELAQYSLVPLIAPSRRPLLVELEAVLVQSSGVNPRIDGAAEHFYEGLSDKLRKIVDDLGV